MTLNDVLKIQSYSGAEFRMFAFIIRQLKKAEIHYTTDDVGNIYAQKGSADTFPCVVAHMDTVHKIVEDLSILQVGDLLTGFNRTTMKQTGIGGDDKVGVYIALKCLEEFDNIKVAFFVDEERGCVGSGGADVAFFADCRFILQADRRGSTDFVHTAAGVQLSSKKFRKAVGKYLTLYGYKFTEGLMTDVMALKENGVKVSMANVSCGYHRPHSEDEYVHAGQVQKCLELFFSIIENMTDSYPHEYKRVQPSYTSALWSHNKQPSYGYGYGSDKYEDFWKKWDAKYTDKYKITTEKPKVSNNLDTCDNCSRTERLSFCAGYHAWLCSNCMAYYN